MVLSLRKLCDKLSDDVFDAIENKYCPAILMKILDKKREIVHEKWTLKINTKNEIIIEGKTVTRNIINEKKIDRKRIGWKKYSNQKSIIQSIKSISKSLPVLDIDIKASDIRFSFTMVYDEKRTPTKYIPPSMR